MECMSCFAKHTLTQSHGNQGVSRVETPAVAHVIPRRGTADSTIGKSKSRPGSPGQPELDGEMRKSGVGCLPECGENPARRSPSIVDSLKCFPNFQQYSCTTRQGGRAVDVVRKRFT